MNKDRYKVLVAEDEVLILENIAQKVEAAGLGFVVSAKANNGYVALEAMEKALPDLLVTDIKMPLMDGLQLSEKMESMYPHVKKIIISGFSDFEYARHAIRSNVFDYLLKPVREEALREALMKVKAAIDSERAVIGKAVGALPEQLTLEEAVGYMREYIRNNYKEHIDFNTLADNLHYSPEYVHRLFIRQFNESPSKYQIHLRLNEAKRLLANRKALSVKQVAEAVGYEDQSYFSRIFKKYTGVSPLDFRD